MADLAKYAAMAGGPTRGRSADSRAARGSRDVTFNFNSELYADPSLAEGVDYARRHRRLLSKNLRRTLYERLAASGGIRAEQGRILGVFPARRWLAQDAGHEAEVRRLVTQALVQQRAPDTRSAALIALVHALRCEHKIVDPRRYDLSRRQLRARAKRLPGETGS
jgi:hypothetical protein